MNKWSSTIPLTEMSDDALDVRMVFLSLVAWDGKTKPDAADRAAAAQETADEMIRRFAIAQSGLPH